MESEICTQGSELCTRKEQYGTYVVKELSTSVPLDVVCIEIAPTQLNVNPELVAGGPVKNVFAICDKRWP